MSIVIYIWLVTDTLTTIPLSLPFEDWLEKTKLTAENGQVKQKMHAYFMCINEYLVHEFGSIFC